MNEILLLEWTFTPTDYFEEDVDFSSEACTIRVNNGRAEARIPSDNYPDDHTVRNVLHAELDARFLAVQMLSHKAYTLSKPNLTKLYPDGSKGVCVFVEALTLNLSVNHPNLTTTGSNSIEIQNTKRERIKSRVEYSNLAAKYYSDPIVQSILKSYAAAVNDPRNELIHLFEVIDTLKKTFSNDREKARRAIDVSKEQWDRLWKLANDEPLNQGRHRGKHPGTLRDATDSELDEARRIASKMIQGFLKTKNTIVQ